MADLPPPARRRSVLRLILILVGLFVLLTATGATVANAQLSSTYSAQRAVLDYFAAQQRVDVPAMLASATYLRAPGADARFFGTGALHSMMTLGPNSDIRGVRVVKVRALTADAQAVTVALTWAGTALERTYTVRSDPAQTHFGLYHSWRIQIPFSVLTIKPPNQPGPIAVDGFTVPPGATSVAVIEGYHTVEMTATALWDNNTQKIAALAAEVPVEIMGSVSSTAVSAAKQLIDEALANCDAATYNTCPNHPYSAPAGVIYVTTLPGYGDVDYSTYVIKWTHEPTDGMQLVVDAQPGQLSASGACSQTWTLDGSRPYYFKGTWTATLTLDASGFISSAEVDTHCHQARA